MRKQFSVLFDMDGVLIDTETHYDKFWEDLCEQYTPNVDNFIEEIKGLTLLKIVNTYFSHLTEKDRNDIISMTSEFETQMPFDEIPGVLKFARELKEAGIKIGLVTSSNQLKLDAVNRVHLFDELFDGLVCSDEVVKGKPDPECYLLGAKKIGANPEDCIVFEDALAGIQSATDAGMRAIALSTTHSVDKLKEKVDIIIPDFRDFNLEKLKSVI